MTLTFLSFGKASPMGFSPVIPGGYPPRHHKKNNYHKTKKKISKNEFF
jgi:hypothetical protein